MLTFPNGKINIGLSVTAKRGDGYHDLETIFYPVGIKDALEIIDAKEEGSSLHVSGLAVAGKPDENLAWKAFTLLKQDFPRQIKSLSIHLHKVIPMGAGLGGGSADGAFMLAMLNRHFKLDLNTAALERYALQLGSDCPFFISNKTAFAKGRGELLEEMELDLSEYSLQLVFPQLHISTAAAFAGIMPKAAAFSLKNIRSLPVTEWKDIIRNDFESTLFPRHPVLQKIKDQLYSAGALYASLSGTGSTVYGIFKKGKQAEINLEIPVTQHYIL